MKISSLILLPCIVIGLAMCKTKKNTSTSSSSTTPSSTATNTANSSDGIYEPGEKEVMALQMQHADITLDKLKEGYVLYISGACIKCHGPKNIYKRPESRWKDIIDNMAKMAKLNESQTDAVYKYVLAIKANQPK